MNAVVRHLIIYFELILLTGSFCFIPPVYPDYFGSNNQKSTAVLKSEQFFSDIINQKDSHELKEERVQQFKFSKLFLLNDPLAEEFVNYSAVQKTKILTSYSTPDYLLSSDLKSPPNC